MNIHRFLPFLALSILLSFSFTNPVEDPPVVEGGLKWYTDLSAANQEATESGKPIFAFFTGSDWCGWCKKLQADVFRKEAFVSWAQENVVLLELDFPRRTQLPQAQAQQNYQIQQALGVRGYPTVWFITMSFDAEKNNYNINKLGSTGYPRGATPGKEEDKFIAASNAIIARMPKPTSDGSTN